MAALGRVFVVEISRCRAPLHRSTTEAVRHAVDVELYSFTLLYSAPERSTSLQLYSALHSTSSTPSLSVRCVGRTHDARVETGEYACRALENCTKPREAEADPSPGNLLSAKQPNF